LSAIIARAMASLRRSIASSSSRPGGLKRILVMARLAGETIRPVCSPVPQPAVSQ